jgi:hypothetical protein
MAVLFVLTFLPETKGLSVEEITAMFEQQAAERGVVGPASPIKIAHPRDAARHRPRAT